jgi:hypothetical protein
MKITTQDYNVTDIINCSCGHEFNIHDIDGLIPIDNHGFYSNVVKYGSHIHCPKCHKETILLLKQKGQTWEILGIATKKEKIQESSKKQATTIENKTVSNTSNEIICPICQKVCKSKLGLNAHMKTHNK